MFKITEACSSAMIISRVLGDLRTAALHVEHSDLSSST